MSASAARVLRCVTCGRDFPLDAEHGTCAACGPLAGTLDVVYDLAAVARVLDPAALRGRPEPTLWRYRELLPVGDPSAAVPIPAGMTPLVPLDAASLAEPGTAVPRRLLV
ncbi:MAG: hypothetical protein PVF43_15745, partial [Candidatus Eiseniibacteriota bacterium]